VVKARRLAEIKELLASRELLAWWESLTQARNALAEATAQYDELLTQAMLMDFRAELAQKNAIDTLYRSGEHEDAAASLLVESTELENQSFKSVSDFEELRFRTSDSWYKLGASERQLEDLREQLALLVAQRDKAQGGAKRELEARLSQREHELKLGERTYRQLHSEYEREAGRKARIWEEVERIWARSAEMSLTMAEKKMQAKKVRREAESLFAQAEERKQRAQKLRAEADASASAREQAQAKASEVLSAAKEQFGCALGDEFLYFRERDQSQRAFAVALVADSTTFNIELAPLAVYTVDRARGVSFLEPAVETPPSAEEGDRRFEAYFLQGRKGERKTLAAS
jgi:hypothetical protein